MIDNKERIDQFQTCWHQSIAAQLLVPEPRQNVLELGQEAGFLASIAFLAFERGELCKLDSLLERWHIASKGTQDFKGKLRENWLLKDAPRRRDVCNDTLAALSELSVASYLEDTGCSIVDLGAWGNSRADVVFRTADKDVFVEVKYFSDNPELYQQRLSSATTGDCTVDSIPNTPTLLNYLYYRLAQAAIQLGAKNVPGESKMVFFVFSTSAADARLKFEASLGKQDAWYEDYPGSWPGVLLGDRAEVLGKTPQQWVEKAKRFFIGTMASWQLENITTASSEHSLRSCR